MKVTDKKFLNVHQTISPLTATTINGKYSDHHNGNSASNVSSQLAAVINGVNAVNGSSSSGLSPTSGITISASGTTNINDIPMQTSPESISSTSSSLSSMSCNASSGATNNQSSSIDPKSSSSSTKVTDKIMVRYYLIQTEKVYWMRFLWMINRNMVDNDGIYCGLYFRYDL